MTTALRDSFSDKALEHTLDLINCHMPHPVYTSKYSFLKTFGNPDYKEYFYCYDCSQLLIFETESENQTKCRVCQKIYKKSILKKKNDFFLYIPIKKQLEELINSSLYLKLRKFDPDVSDVISGNVYRRLRADRTINDQDITLIWNTDGVSFFESSKLSIYPLLFNIIELPYRLRKNNVLLCGLWYNKQQPKMNIFLKPFVEELIELSVNGFYSTTYQHKKPINIKVHAILSSVDSVARPKIQNVHQYNGDFGCSYCYHKGKTIKVGKGRARIYSCGEYQMRTADLYLQDVREAVKKKQVVRGVKGPSIISLIPNHDIIRSCPPEFMHSVLLGVIKLFAKSWFNSEYKNKKWYLGNKVADFVERLSQIKPPTEITRPPRWFGEHKLKAHEWKNQGLYYLPVCLLGILPTKYYNHWCKFVYSLHILLQTKITAEELELAKKLLISFVEKIEEYYGQEFMRFNVHILVHLPDFVKQFGALWAWSAFPFENYNGILKHLFHGTQCLPQQICKMYFRLRYVKSHSYIFNSDRCSPMVRNQFLKLMNECKIKNCITYERLRLFGKPKTFEVSLREKISIQLASNGKSIKNMAESFDRFIYENILYHTSENKRLVKRCNSYVQIEDDKIVNINKLIKVRYVLESEPDYFILVNTMEPTNHYLFQQGEVCLSKFSKCVKQCDQIRCYKLSAIKCKCVVIPYKNYYYAFFLVNHVETD